MPNLDEIAKKLEGGAFIKMAENGGWIVTNRPGMYDEHTLIGSFTSSADLVQFLRNALVDDRPNDTAPAEPLAHMMPAD